MRDEEGTAPEACDFECGKPLELQRGMHGIEAPYVKERNSAKEQVVLSRERTFQDTLLKVMVR